MPEGRELKQNKGITIVALILTVIVLLILAGVIAVSLTGDDALINRSIKAKDIYNAATAKEKIQLEVYNSRDSDGNIDREKLKDNLKDNLGIDPDDIEEDENGNWKFPVGDIEVTIDPEGNTTPEDKTQDRPITIYFDYYSLALKGETREERQVTILTGDSEERINPPRTIDTTIVINRKEVKVTPVGWSKSIDGSTGLLSNYEDKLTVTKRDDGKTFYMIYSYDVKASVTDERGNLEEKDYVIEVGSDGNKANTGNNENFFNFPKNPKIPDEWQEPAIDPGEFSEDLKFEGWVKKDQDNPKEGFDGYKDIKDPEKEMPDPGDKYYPKFSKNIRVRRYVYPNSTKMETDIVERVYSIWEEIFPVTVNLGKGEEVEYNRKLAIPERWVTNLENPKEGKTVTIADGTTIDLTRSTDFYMIYKVKAVIKVQDENGILQEREMFSHIDCNGNPQKGPNDEEDDKIEFPEKTKIPDIWKDKNPEDLEFKGWSKKNIYDEPPEFKDVDLSTDIPAHGDEYYFRYELTIHVNRYVYKDGQPNQKMDELQGTVVAIGEDIHRKAEVPLGTTEEVVFDGRTATPDRWVTDLDNEDPEKSVKVNENAILEDDEDYYIMYLIKLTVSMPDENGDMQKVEIQEEIGADGKPHSQDVDRTLKLPDTPKPPDGWGKDDDVNPNPPPGDRKYGEGVEFEGWIKKNATTMPDGGYKDVDPETEIPQEGDEYYPTFKRTVTITLDVNTGIRGNIPETLTGEMKAIGQEVTQKALITMPEEQPTKPGYDYLGWYDNKETIEGSNRYESGQQYDTFTYSMTLYAMWKDVIQATVEIDPIGKPEWQQEHTVKVTAKDNEDVKELTLKYLWNQNPDKELVEEDFNEATEFTTKEPTLSGEEQAIVETIKTPKRSGDNWYLWVFAKDKAGNIRIVHSDSFWIDNTPPENIKSISITEATTYSITVEASATTDAHSGLDKYLFSINTAPDDWKEVSVESLNGANPTYTFTGLAQNQNYIVTVKAIDKVGLETDPISTDGQSGTSKVPGGSDNPEESAIKFEMHEIEEDGTPREEVWTGKNWTNKRVQLLVKYDLLNGQDFDVEYSMKSNPKPDSSEDWQEYDKVNGITLDANAVVYARLKEKQIEGQKPQYGDYATTNILMIDRVAPNPFDKLPQVIDITTNTITIQGTTTDDLSQIKEYKYSCSEISIADPNSDSLVWADQDAEEDSGTHTFKKLTQGQIYYFRIKAIDNAGNETISGETVQRVDNIPDPSLDQSIITFEYNENTADGKAWDKNWTKSDIAVTAKLAEQFEGIYAIETTQTPEQDTTWKKDPTVIINKNGTVYARLVDSEDQHSAGNASTNISKIDKHAPEGLAIDDVSTTTNSVKVDAHEATDPKEEGASDLEPSSGVEGYYFRLDEDGEWLTNADDHKKRTYTFINGQDGTATIATISDEPIMTMEAPTADGLEVEQGSVHTVYVKVRDNAGNETDDDAVKQENVIVKTIPGTGSDEQNITFEMTTKASGEEVPWHDTDAEWTKGPVTVRVNNATSADYGNLKIEYIYQETGKTTDEAPADGWQEYNKGTGITDIVTNGTIWVRLKEDVPEGKPAQTGKPVKLELKHIDSVQPEEFSVAPVISDIKTDTFKVQGTTTDSISSIKEYKYSYTTDAGAQENTLTWENQTEGEDPGTHTFKNLKQGTTYYVRVKAIDQAGNERISNPVETKTTEVPSPQDVITFTMTVDGEPWDGTQWTRGPVKVEINNSGNRDNQNFKIQYSTMDNPNIDSEADWQDYPTEEGIIVTENKSIHARLKEEVGDQHSANYNTLKLEKVDAIPPEDFITESIITSSTTNTITITGTTIDTLSQIREYKYSCSEKSTEDVSTLTWEDQDPAEEVGTHTFRKLTQGKAYYLRIKAIDNVGNEKVSEEIVVSVGTLPDPSLEESAITFEYTELAAEEKEWDKNWTKNDVRITAKIAKKYEGTYTIETTQTPDQDATWEKETDVTLNKNGTVYARLVDSEDQHSAGYASTNISKIDKHAPTGLAIDGVSTTTNSVQVDAHEATDPKEEGASDLEPSSGVEGYYFRLDETGAWLTNTDDHKKRTYTFINGQDGTATIATISDEPIMTMAAPTAEGMEVEQGSKHTVYVKVKDNAGNETADDAVKQENIIVKTIPGAGNNEQNITFEMTTRATGREVPWHDTDDEWTKGPVTVKVNNSTTADYGKLKLEYIYQKTGQTTTEAPADGWQDYNTGTGITNLVTNGTIWVRLKEDVPERRPAQTGKPVKLELKHIDSVSPDEFKVAPTITDITTNSFKVQGTTTDSISSIKEYKYSYTADQNAQISSLSWQSQTEGEEPGTHTFNNLVQGTTYYVRIKAIDQAGNERISNPVTTQTMGVPNAQEVLTFTMSVNGEPWDGKKWTQGPVKVEITNSGNRENQTFKIQYSTKDTPSIDSAEDWQDYKADQGIIVTENKSVHARLKEETGDQHSSNYKTLKIEKVDAVPPEPFVTDSIKVTATTNSITISGKTTDTISQIAKYQFGYTTDASAEDTAYKWEDKTPQEAEGTHTFTGLPKYTMHYLKIKAIDNAGNERVSERKQITTDEMPSLADSANISITYELSEGRPLKQWNNENIYAKITLKGKVKEDVDNGVYKLQYTKTKASSINGATEWTEYTGAVTTTGIEYEYNGDLTVRLFDGTNEGAYAVGEVSTIDKLPPIFPLHITWESITSSTLTIKGTAEDQTDKTGANATSGLEGYYFDIDNQFAWITNPDKLESSHTFTGLPYASMHVLRVKAKDNAGNESVEQVVPDAKVKAIPGGGEADPDKPGEQLIKFKLNEVDPTTGAAKPEIWNEVTWTNNSIKVTASKAESVDASLKIQTSKTGQAGDWQDTNEIIMEKNGTVYARFSDGENGGPAATHVITRIDKTPPIKPGVPALEATTNSIKATTLDAVDIGDSKTEADASGMYAYFFSISEKSVPNDQISTLNWEAASSNILNTTYTFANKKQNTPYYVRVKAVDIAGNEVVSDEAMKLTNKVPDLQQTDLQFSYNPPGETDGPVTVTIQINNEALKGFSIQWCRANPGNEESWEPYDPVNDPIVYTENGPVYARIVDSTRTTFC